MSNIYTSVAHLSALLTDVTLPIHQRQFVTKFLDGDDRDLGLKKLAIRPLKDKLETLKATITAEIRQTPYVSLHKPHFNLKYIKVLKEVLTDISAVQKSQERIATFGTKNPARFKKYAKKMDSIFQETQNTYHGIIMLAVSQGLDIRLGKSRGECFGYIAEWASDFLQNKKPFGISLDNPPPFSPIKLDSPVGRKYPELNHLAILSENVSIFQSIQTDYKRLKKEIASRLGYQTKVVHYKKGIGVKFYHSLGEIVDKLVTMADDKSEKIYHLKLMGYMGGHALGFCKREGQYHFFDSNSMWVRFDNPGDFKRWLPYYFKKIGYDKMFGEYMINTYSLTPKTEEKKKESIPIWVKILISPILISYLAIILTNLFIIRGFRYAAIDLKKAMYPDPIAKEEEPNVASTQREMDSSAKSIEYLDLAIAPPKQPKHESSFVKIAAMLDIPLKDLVKVRERSLANREFQRTAAPLVLETTIENAPEAASLSLL